MLFQLADGRKIGAGYTQDLPRGMQCTSFYYIRTLGLLLLLQDCDRLEFASGLYDRTADGASGTRDAESHPGVDDMFQYR